MIFNCFIDDSKDSKQDHMYVCAGWIGERNDWIAFSRQWNKRLQADGLSYFKASEYNRLRGQFERFRLLPAPDGRNAARAIRDDLLKIVRHFENLRSVGVCVPLDEWNTVANRPEAKGIIEFPYHRAIESVWTETIKRGFRSSRFLRNSVVTFIHDNGPNYEQLESLYDAFKRLNPKTSKFMRGFSRQDDKSCAPLQAADLMANHSLDLAMKWLKNGKKLEDKPELETSMGFLAIWREEYARGVLHHELKRKKLPIPDDLEQEFGSKHQ